MFLSDRDIKRELDGGALRITSDVPVERRIQPSSVELHLGSEFKVYDTDPIPVAAIDPLQDQAMLPVPLDENNHFWLYPHQFALGHTIERIRLGSRLAAQVDGKSSLARLGLQVHMTSGFCDPGFEGQITLEFFNAAPKPIILRPRMVIAQLFIIPMSSSVDRPYGSPGVDSQYQGQTGATQSRYGDHAWDEISPGAGLDPGKTSLEELLASRPKAQTPGTSALTPDLAGTAAAKPAGDEADFWARHEDRRLPGKTASQAFLDGEEIHP